MAPAKRGIDIAWERPTVAQIMATGAQWVARYLSTDKTKNLAYAEVAAYVQAGLEIVTVWETAAARALAGFAAGQSDARAAEVQRKALGLPGDHVHYFAVDTDTDWGAVVPYFQGIASVLPIARVGPYGGIKVITGAHRAGYRYLWQTVAWSGGAWHPAATIRQPGSTVLGGTADVDYAMATDFGQFPRPAAPAPAPQPPAPGPLPPFPKEKKMIMVAVDLKTLPKDTEWPGIFLLTQDLKLCHVTTPEDEKAFKDAQVTGPFTISYAQFAALQAAQ